MTLWQTRSMESSSLRYASKNAVACWTATVLRGHAGEDMACTARSAVDRGSGCTLLATATGEAVASERRHLMGVLGELWGTLAGLPVCDFGCAVRSCWARVLSADDVLESLNLAGDCGLGRYGRSVDRYEGTGIAAAIAVSGIDGGSECCAASGPASKQTCRAQT